MNIIKKIQRIWPLFPAAIYLLAFLIIVLTYLIVLSFSDKGGLFPSFEPLQAVINMQEFRDALLNTFLFVLVGTPLELLAGLLLAFLIYNSFKMRGVVRSIFIIPVAIPALVTATLLFILFDTQGGFINHLLMGKYKIFPALIESSIDWRGTKVFSLGLSLFGKVWRDMPISMLILLAGLNSIDTQLFDVAKTMGAGLRHRLFNIIIPLILPSISAVVLLRSIEMWKEFIFPYILAGRYNLLGTLIESLYITWEGKYESEAAIVALILVICIITGAIIFIKGLEIVKRMLSDIER